MRQSKTIMSLLAIDIGSSRCKAVVFALTGEILTQHACAYTPEFPAPSHAEIDPERFWQAVCHCSQAVSKNLSDPVRALCLSSHGETFVPVNATQRSNRSRHSQPGQSSHGRNGVARKNIRKKATFRNHRPGRSSHVSGAEISLAA